jgi:putative helicase MOV10L1
MLAGDPRQLGPVLRSATAAAAGLGVSLLDSWIQFWHTACPELAAAQLRKHQQQQQQPGSRQPVHDAECAAAAAAEAAGRVMLCYGMLSDNYRSHVRLLDLPSRLFYGGALRACAPPAAVAPPRWSELMVHGPDGSPEAAAADSAAAAAGPEGDVSDSAASEAASAAGAGAGGVDDVLGPSSTLFVGVNGEQRQVCTFAAAAAASITTFMLTCTLRLTGRCC